MSNSTIIDRLRSVLSRTAPFDRLPREALAEVVSAVIIDYIEEGEVLIEQGSMTHPGLFIVESGMVRLMDVSSQRLLDKCGEGDTFGSFGLLKGGATIYEARATEPTVIALLKNDDFQRFFRAYPDFRAFFESDLKQYIRRMYSDVDVSGRHRLFSRSLASFAHRRIVFVDPEATAQRVARLMHVENVDLVAVGNEERVAGLIAMNDVLYRVVDRANPPDLPAKNMMRRPMAIADSATLFDALALMMRLGTNHLLITDSGKAGGRPLAILRERDLAHFRAQDPLASIGRIAAARHEDDLRDVRSETSDQLLNLYRQGANPEMVNGIMTIVYDRVTVRILEIVERRLKRDYPDDEIELPWVWLRLGSGGRREMSLTSQQHNALLYEDPRSDEEAEVAARYFNRLADRVNTALEACGFEPSDVVARNERWRRPARAWRQAYREWIHQSDESAIRYAMPFFDLRGIYGHMPLMDSLSEDIVDALNVQAMDEERDFLPLLASRAVENRPPLSFFRRFVVERSGEHKRAFDIRDRGIMPVVNAARVLAIEMRYLESTNTFDRLRAASDAYPDLSSVIDRAVDAYRFLVDFRIESQLRSMEAGDKPTNHIDPSTLNNLQQNLLRSAFASVSDFQDAIARRYDLARRGWLPGLANRAGLLFF